MPASTIDLMGTVRDVERSRGEDFDKDVDSKFHIVYGDSLAQPLKPKPWLCRDLRIAPGAPLIFGGAGYSGKTMAAQAFALAVATGRKLWGFFDVRQGEVIHLDWEQDELTVRRYQRMARSMRVDLCDLGKLIGASMIPNTSLDATGTGWAERALAHICRGKALCVIDSFRQAFEGVDENSSSSVAIAMKMLSRVSYATGCVILLIAHSRKLTDDTASVRSSLRGSGAIFDASNTVYMLTGHETKPAYVENVKERHTGKKIPKFGLRYMNEDGPNMGDDPYVVDDIDSEWGLRVEYVSEPEMQAEYSRKEESDNCVAINSDRLRTIGLRILELLATAPDGLQAQSIIGLLKGVVTHSDFRSAIPFLIESRSVEVEGKGSTSVYRAVSLREPGID